MIIYFSGTGNSEHIARILAESLNDTLIDSTKLIKAGEHPEFSSDKPYVFVAPVYAWRLPRLLEDWIRGCTFAGSKKAYFLLTCGGEIGAAGEYARRFAVGLGFDYMGTVEILMPENYIAMFSAPTEEEAENIISDASQYALTLAEKIASQKPLDEVKLTLTGRLCSGIVNSCFYTFCIGAKKFFVTDKCISCGRCVQSCMLNNITLKDGKPIWGSNCTHCMACICKCPTEAIEYGRHTKGLHRYTFPENHK